MSDEPSDKVKGDITKEFTAWCGCCPNWYQVGHVRTKKQATNFFKRVHGWKLTKENGWICPICANRDTGGNT